MASRVRLLQPLLTSPEHGSEFVLQSQKHRGRFEPAALPFMS